MPLIVSLSTAALVFAAHSEFSADFNSASIKAYVDDLVEHLTILLELLEDRFAPM